MKNIRLILVALFAAMSASVSAQFMGQKSDNSGLVRYQGEVNVGTSFLSRTTSLSVGTVQGVMISDYFFAGLGVDGVVDSQDFGFWNIAPHLSLRGYLPLNDNCRLFLNFNVGATISVAEGDSAPEYLNDGSVRYDGYTCDGNYFEMPGSTMFMWQCMAGIQFRKIQLSIGFTDIAPSSTNGYYISRVGSDQRGLIAKIGYVF